MEDSSPSGAVATGAFAAGRVIAGKYRLEGEIAKGGLGVVMRATHIELGQLVAIKHLKPEVLAKPVLVERFKREAQLAAAIRSDHVVRVYDVGSLDVGGPYMVMELLEGEDLGAYLRRGPLPIEQAVDYVIQACDALAEAHALGIAHRDLKPENLFLARRSNTSPVVKILDFGISKTYERKKTLEGAPLVRRMTEVGERFGTPLYMSPEQFLGTSNDVDARTDIWSLGVVLYELVTGTLPFEGETMATYGANVVRTPATPLRVRLPQASEGLEAVLAKCLEKDPAKRYRNVGELVVELVSLVAPTSRQRTERIKRVVLEGGESIRPPRPISSPEITVDAIPPIAVEPSRAKLIAAILGVIAVIALAVGVYAVRSSPRPVPMPAAATPTTATVPPPPPPTAMTAAATTTPAVTTATAAPKPTATVRPSISAPPSAPTAVSAPPPPKPDDYSEFGARH